MKIIKIFSAIAIAFLTGLIISCGLNPAEETTEPIIVNFPDPNFEALIRETLDIPDGDIKNYDMWTIKQLSGVGRNIEDISGIEYCSGLTILSLRGNYIINIEPLSDLVLLNHIDLQNNLIIDIQPLFNNTGIGIGNDAIYLYGNPLSNESILQYKPQIQARGVKFYSNAELASPGEINFMDDNFEAVIREHLNIPAGAILNTDLESLTNIFGRNRNIQNIYGIEFCTNLDTLDIGFNGISDLIPLFYLRKMKSLKLDNNTIDDISPIRYFYQLTELALNNNNIENLSYISSLTKLTTLSLNNNNLESINDLANLNNLLSLLLNNTNIQDISPLSNLSNLQYLTLSGNPIFDFEPISKIDSLKNVELLDLSQFDFSQIVDIDNLQTINLTNTLTIINLGSIAEIISLRYLIMNNCNLSNIDSLAGLENLIRLGLSNNLITNINSIADLYQLSELVLSNNNVSDILPLIDNWGISGTNDYVLIYNNPLNEESINTYIPQLQARGVHVYY